MFRIFKFSLRSRKIMNYHLQSVFGVQTPDRAVNNILESKHRTEYACTHSNRLCTVDFNDKKIGSPIDPIEFQLLYDHLQIHWVHINRNMNTQLDLPSNARSFPVIFSENACGSWKLSSKLEMQSFREN